MTFEPWIKKIFEQWIKMTFKLWTKMTIKNWWLHSLLPHSLNNKPPIIIIITTSHFPISACGPGPQLLPVSVCSISETLHLPAFPLAIVLYQVPDVQCHPCIQLHPLHTWLHGMHKGLGFLTAQTLTPDIQNSTLNAVQDGDQVTPTDILDIDTPCHTGGKGGQVLSWDWGQVNIIQAHILHRAKKSMVSQAGSADDFREFGQKYLFLDSPCQCLKHSMSDDTSGF